MTELLRGRERRYFGYTKNTAHKVDTPESAKSFRSVMSPVTREAIRKYEPVKTFKPDPAGRSRFADKIVHRAVRTQIPGLLPALKNSPQFDAVGDIAIDLRSPDIEHHRGRSMHYMWLPGQDRSELCGIFQSHIKTKEKARIRNVVSVKKKAGLSGMAAEVAAMEQQEYLESIAKDPRFVKNRQKRLTAVPSRILRMNRKFQASYWDPTAYKNLPDPFRRGRNKVPAIDAICHEQFGQTQEYADLMTCVKEYNRRQQQNQELTAEHLELEAAKEQTRRLSLFGNLEDEERRRGMKHIKQLCEYDKDSNLLWKKQAKLIVSAAEYINKIKAGRRFPTPPKEILRKRKKKAKSMGGASSNAGSHASRSTIDINDYTDKPGFGKNPRQDAGQEEERNKKPIRRKKHKHYHHNYNSDDFYMEMYLHFLNPDEDVSLKRPPTQLTDIQDVRRQMNLDEDVERDRSLIDILNAESVEDLHIDITQSYELSPDDKANEKEILEKYAARLNNPRMTRMLTKMASKMSLAPDMLKLSSDSLASTKKESREDGDETEALTDATVKSTPPSKPVDVMDDDDELDQMGDIPEHELKIIMSNIDVSDNPSDASDNLSSESSDNEEEEEGEEEEGKEIDDEIKLFRTVKKKKDSLAEFMDLTAEFRQRVCKAEEGKPPHMMNPFAEAVCVLYPDGPEKKSKKDNKQNKMISTFAFRKL